jgi:hypothetical protein
VLGVRSRMLVQTHLSADSSKLLSHFDAAQLLKIGDFRFELSGWYVQRSFDNSAGAGGSGGAHLAEVASMALQNVIKIGALYQNYSCAVLTALWARPGFFL